MNIKGDADVRAALNKYTDMVYRTAYSRTRSHADAEDITQDVFLALVRKNPDFADERAQKAWLIRVTINRANSLWRKIKRMPVIRRDDVPKPGTEIEIALEKLDTDERTLIYLYYYEMLTSNEISEITGISAANVRKKLSRARAKMRDFIGWENKNDI